MTSLEVKEENGQKFVEGIGSGWIVKGKEFVVLAASEDDLLEALAWLPGGECADPLFFRKLKCFDLGSLAPAPHSSVMPEESRARVLED